MVGPKDIINSASVARRTINGWSEGYYKARSVARRTINGYKFLDLDKYNLKYVVNRFGDAGNEERTTAVV